MRYRDMDEVYDEGAMMPTLPQKKSMSSPAPSSSILLNIWLSHPGGARRDR